MQVKEYDHAYTYTYNYNNGRFARGVRGHAPPPKKNFLMVQFGAFWSTFGSDLVLNFFFNLPFFI